jgi:hypothetical protein
MIVESQDAKSFPRQERISTRIALQMFRLKMLPAIDFDDEPRGMANEIHDIRPNRSLAPKACTIHSMGTQCPPNDQLCISGILP